jgi:Fic-DOC domain mobile mystery protein B
MELDAPYPDGQTPLDETEREALLIPTIATRAELDEFEQQNIEKAVLWSMNRRFKAETVLTEAFLKAVHRRMYGDVWAWAGQFRKTNKNIGVDKWQIPTSLRSLLDDALFWNAHHSYPPDEFTLRFKHRLVSIHCFPNGNGRHSRFVADLLIEKVFNQPLFTWGAATLPTPAQRSGYLSAIKVADAGNFEPLIAFARS